MNNPVLHTLHPADNVAVALVDLTAGDTIENDGDRILLIDPILFGHKVALADVRSGEPVLKYGEQIGLASRDIRRGQHVHVHNIASTRGRGDLPEPAAATPSAAPTPEAP